MKFYIIFNPPTKTEKIAENKIIINRKFEEDLEFLAYEISVKEGYL
jgi:hypothetical protein